jgi:hypothetical protein
MLGTAAIVMWWDVPPEMRAAWEEWHTVEHMPERLSIPGFLRGTRWVAESGEPSYFVLYEVANLATMTGGAYLERLNNPTPWSRKMMPHHLNMVRSLCVLRAGWGGGLPQTLATVRFSPQAGQQPRLPQRKGLTGAHLLESQPTPAALTTEQKIRGGDAVADWALLVGGYDADAVKAAAAEAAPAGAMTGFYRPAYSLTAQDRK